MSWIEDPGVQTFEGLDLTKLKVDEAYVKAATDDDSWLYYLSSDCYRCPYTRLSQISKNGSVFVVKVAHSQKWRVFPDGTDYTIPTDNDNYLCDLEPDMGEFGVYRLGVWNRTCNFETLKKAVNIYLPILVAILCLVGVGLLCQLLSYLSNKYLKSASSKQENAPGRRRIRALDTFRGMSIVLMIFVNDGAGHYWWLEHATWNGLTVGDLVFPFFLWIMGVCIPISAKSLMSKSVPKYSSLLNIFRRSCTLFLIGLGLGTQYGVTLDKMRIFGVLQRFGVSYFFVASMVVLMSRKWKGENENKWKAAFQDVLDLGWQWLIMLILIGVHLVIIFTLPVPDCPKGFLGAGGKQDNWTNKDCIGGATNYIDKVVLGEFHLYQNPTAKEVYESGAFDPEGIFGCILSVVHVFFGVQAGNTLLHYQKWKELIGRWLSWALLTGFIGGLLCNFSKEDGVIPVNKNLWSLSFVMITCCFSFILLSVFYVLIDVTKVWSGTPFIQPGMNAIVMYVGHSLCHAVFPFHWAVTRMNTHFIRLMESLWGTLLWIAVAFMMARKKFFITI